MSIPTAKEIIEKQFFGFKGELWIGVEKVMVEFAKLHCEAQREAILVNAEAELEFEGFDELNDHPIHSAQVVKATIINAYPLSNIK